MKRFELGEIVSWRSQAQGFDKVKTGEVVEVLMPGMRPDRERFPDLYRGPGVGLGRDHISYVVQVGRKHYWPRVKHLRGRLL
jgi:hypothetical protein